MANHNSTRNSSFGSDAEPLPDAQGQAALLLVESLIHTLLDRGTLTKREVLEVIGSAMQVKAESAAEEKEAAPILQRSLMLLRNMGLSIAAHEGLYDNDPAGDRRPDPFTEAVEPFTGD